MQSQPTQPQSVSPGSAPGEAPSPTRRKTGQVVCCPIVFGSIAFWLGKRAAEEQSHRWTIYVRGLQNEDLSYLIKKVVFKLHPSCQVPVVVAEQPPFEVTQLGWGEFEAIIRIYFTDSSERPIDLHHVLRLYPPGQTSALSAEPVVHELYEEIVFSEPTTALYHKVLSGPTKPLLSNPNAEHLSTFSEVSDMHTLLKAHNFVRDELVQVRTRLGEVDAQIDAMEGPIAKKARKGSDDAEQLQASNAPEAAGSTAAVVCNMITPDTLSTVPEAVNSSSNAAVNLAPDSHTMSKPG